MWRNASSQRRSSPCAWLSTWINIRVRFPSRTSPNGVLPNSASRRIEIEQVVADLERGPEMEAELADAIEVGGRSRADEGAHAQRIDGCVPARLGADQGQIVIRLEIDDVVLPPGQFLGLPLDGPLSHRQILSRHPFLHA